MLDTVEAMRLFSDGRMSIHDTYALLESIGHSREACAQALDVLSSEDGASIRVGAYVKGEWHAELYLTATS